MKRVYLDMQIKKNTEGAAVIRRFKPGDIVCEEGDFGSTAFYIVGGHVDIYIANPLASVKTRAGGNGFFSLFRKVSSVLGKNETGPGADQGFIPIGMRASIAKNDPAGLSRAGELFGEMTVSHVPSAVCDGTGDRGVRDDRDDAGRARHACWHARVDIATKATSKERRSRDFSRHVLQKVDGRKVSRALAQQHIRACRASRHFPRSVRKLNKPPSWSPLAKRHHLQTERAPQKPLLIRTAGPCFAEDGRLVPASRAAFRRSTSKREYWLMRTAAASRTSWFARI